MLWHLCIIALVGLVPSEKEGKISTDHHVAARISSAEAQRRFQSGHPTRPPELPGPSCSLFWQRPLSSTRDALSYSYDLFPFVPGAAGLSSGQPRYPDAILHPVTFFQLTEK